MVGICDGAALEVGAMLGISEGISDEVGWLEGVMLGDELVLGASVRQSQSSCLSLWRRLLPFPPLLNLEFRMDCINGRSLDVNLSLGRPVMQSHAKGSPPEMVGIFVTCDVGFAICTGVPVDGLGDGSLVLLVDGADDVEGASVGERLGAFVRVGSLDGDSLGGCDAVGTPGIVRTGSLQLLLQYLVN
jgi:hypothetical protein